jgi:phosphatidylserine/phosphatidylglycerophosphate/cardiolipin synthase-like enzyme
MKLLVQPGDGATPLLKGIRGAKNRIQIMIFRFDQREIERALAQAVKRGVFVHALIAHLNRSGEDGLRDLEMRLLAAGVNVARTASDLARYHGKLMIVDRRELYLLAFNFTNLDIERSRSFGIITTNARLVHEAERLFEADTQRRTYEAERSNLVVSPVNARKQLSAFIRAAKKELLIYDPTISDPAMVRLLEERIKAGVDVRIIGRLTRKRAGLEARKLGQIRLHVRTMVRDGKHAFIGSQSLREIELDGRREIGIVFRDRRAVTRLAKIFQEDWDLAERHKAAGESEESAPASKVAKKVAKRVTKDLLPITPVLETIIKEVAGNGASVELDAEEVEASVKDAVKEAVREVVKDVVEGAVEQTEDVNGQLLTFSENGHSH